MPLPSQQSPVLGLNLPGAGDPDYNPNGAIHLITAALLALEAQVFGRTKYTAAGAISIQNGTAILKAGSAAAMTLPAPIAGLPGAGGHDGMRLAIVAEDAFAYTVTGPANSINGAKHIATWTAAVGNSIELLADNGAWLTVGTPQGVALT